MLSAPQVEELQQKVRVLQAVGYGAMEAEDGGDPSATASLEAALLSKARRLEHELTMTRLRVAELTGSYLSPLDPRTPECLDIAIDSQWQVLPGQILPRAA